MGVTKLWQLLEEGEEGNLVSLSDCSGQSWAVDLSAWIVHGRTGAEGKAHVSTTFTMMRTVFYRALCLLKHGIKPIIVMDGQTAPEVKSQTLNDRCERTHGHSKVTGHSRAGFQPSNDMCRRLLEALGLTVITSPGEAEKTCALLNSKGIVDACLSDDSDTFLYGAKTVYRNLDVKDESVRGHTVSGIQALLKLGQRDLVVMALLSGCDYGSGVKGVGPKKVMDLIHSINKYSDDVLKRVCDWRDNIELDTLQQQKEQLTSTSKPTHCRQCQHPGNVKQHAKDGCVVCGSSEDCIVDNNVPCTCEFHKLQQTITPYTTELDLREKAMRDQSFPNRQLLNEFLESKEMFEFRNVAVELPRWETLAKEMLLPGKDLMHKMIPVLLFMHLHGTLCLPGAVPLRILRESKQNHVLCYQVLWEQFGFDKWTAQSSDSIEMTPPAKKQESGNPYIVNLPRDLFAKKYPTLVEHFTKSCGKKGKGKRSVEDPSQQKLTQFFKANPAKKRLFQEENQA
ncbi:flap endonuclease GEN homolog 1-like isoform X2 [Littorina saxatilis]|uniref:XPG-I domain-containing protein n=2 Tax=Littorina saxatilis TaxID=31220 RepID=A0AAN9C2W2_9CAEN